MLRLEGEEEAEEKEKEEKEVHTELNSEQNRRLLFQQLYIVFRIRFQKLDLCF